MRSVPSTFQTFPSHCRRPSHSVSIMSVTPPARRNDLTRPSLQCLCRRACRHQHASDALQSTISNLHAGEGRGRPGEATGEARTHARPVARARNEQGRRPVQMTLFVTCKTCTRAPGAGRHLHSAVASRYRDGRSAAPATAVRPEMEKTQGRLCVAGIDL